MNILEQCVDSFKKLIPVQYRFQISRKRIVTEILLDFRLSDFKHLIGLQYLKDIAMSRNSEKVFQSIKDKKLTYEIISRSAFFEKVDDSYANVKERMIFFPLLSEFIESENIILRYVKKKNPYSKINADYVIESTVRDTTAYIFFRRRDIKDENSPYAGISFFLKDKIEYKGETRYWLLKEKIIGERTEVIYQKSGYSEVN